MSAVTLTASDLATYLGADVDEYRATELIARAWQLCEAVVTPLPAAGEAVVLDVAARAYTNPTGTPSQVVGPYSVSGQQGGLRLTRDNRANLRRLAGSGSAFTIETCPDTAGTGLPWWGVGDAGPGWQTW